MNNSRPATDSLAKMTLQVAALLTDGLAKGPTACSVLASALAKRSSVFEVFGLSNLQTSQMYENKTWNGFKRRTHHPDHPPESLSIFCSNLRRSVDNESNSFELCKATVSEMGRPPSRSKFLTCHPTPLRLEALMQAPVHLHNSIKRYSFMVLGICANDSVTKMKADHASHTRHVAILNLHLAAPRRI